MARIELHFKYLLLNSWVGSIVFKSYVGYSSHLNNSREGVMESQKPSGKESPRSQSMRANFEIRLRDAIMNHLDSLSDDGKVKVLDFINALIDLEQKKLELNRRQGRLYHWSKVDDLST